MSESVSPRLMYPELLSLGLLIAECRIVLYEADGREREVLVKLGLPVQTLPDLYRCPAQIIGLGFDERIFSPAGLDAIEAIFSALHLVGQILDLKAKELSLTNRNQGTESTIFNWTWKYRSTE